jgi:membrane associated rhomboid family serine protease
MPPVTKSLLIANVAVFLLQSVADPLLVVYFALWPPTSPSVMGMPAETAFMPWQLVTYSFLHGGAAHLFFNMLGLYMFGSDLERVFGSRRYLTYYFVCVIVAGLAQLLVAIAAGGPPYPTLGASGGVFGLLLAFGMYFPHRTVLLIFPPVPMPAWLFVSLYGAVELFMGVTGTQAGVAHFAHLGGMLGGYLLIRYWRGGPRGPRRSGF